MKVTSRILIDRAVTRIRRLMDRGDMTTARKRAGCMWYRTGWDDGFNAGRRYKSDRGDT